MRASAPFGTALTDLEALGAPPRNTRRTTASASLRAFSVAGLGMVAVNRFLAFVLMRCSFAF
jgi:hypothetical protein